MLANYACYLKALRMLLCMLSLAMHCHGGGAKRRRPPDTHFHSAAPRWHPKRRYFRPRENLQRQRDPPLSPRRTVSSAAPLSGNGKVRRPFGGGGAPRAPARAFPGGSYVGGAYVRSGGILGGSREPSAASQAAARPPTSNEFKFNKI